MKALTKKQKQFARLYVATRNAREAAALLGLRHPETAGDEWLADAAVREEIARLAAERAPAGEAAGGLRRIAFGSVSDAVRLLMTGGEGLDLDRLDLFCVSEIKLPKGGGMEIRFFDRIKALEALARLAEPEQSSLSPFVQAIQKGADRLAVLAEEEP